MKPYLTMVGLLLAVLNGLLLLPATRAYTVPVAAIGLVLALLVVALSFLGSMKSNAISEPSPAQAAVSAPPPVTVQSSAPAMDQAEAEVVSFFALLQEKGRLVDFLMEELTSYDDAQSEQPRGLFIRGAARSCRNISRSLRSPRLKKVPKSPCQPDISRTSTGSLGNSVESLLSQENLSIRAGKPNP